MHPLPSSIFGTFVRAPQLAPHAHLVFRSSGIDSAPCAFVLAATGPEESVASSSRAESRAGADYSEGSDNDDGVVLSSGSDSDGERKPKAKPVLTSQEMEKVISATGLSSLNRTRGLGTHRLTRGANRRLMQ